MTKRQHLKGNFIIRCAYAFTIYEMLLKHHLKVLEFDSYENDSQYIRFSSEGHKCKLLGVVNPGFSTIEEWRTNGNITLLVETDFQGEKRAVVEVTLDVRKIHINTMQKICYEVYDWLRNTDDEDWDIFEKELIANWLDTYTC